jgi:REP element-mobilizing transposase RayT
VTSHGIGDAPIFVADVDRVDFLHLLSMAADQFHWKVHAYCLMGTHYHLVVETTTPDLSEGMQHLNGRYAQLFNHRHRRRGHVFEGRFSSWAVRDEPHYAATCEYVHQNPVRAGVCSTAATWPWSKVVVVGEQDAQTLGRAERGDLGRQLTLNVRDVSAEERASASMVPDDQRHVPGRVAGRRHDDERAVAGDVVGAGERADRRAGEIDELGLGERPVLGDVSAHPP